MPRKKPVGTGQYVQNHKNLMYHKVRKYTPFRILVTLCGHELTEYTVLDQHPRYYGVDSIVQLCKVCGLR